MEQLSLIQNKIYLYKDSEDQLITKLNSERKKIAELEIHLKNLRHGIEEAKEVVPHVMMTFEVGAPSISITDKLKNRKIDISIVFMTFTLDKLIIGMRASKIFFAIDFFEQPTKKTKRVDINEVVFERWVDFAVNSDFMLR